MKKVYKLSFVLLMLFAIAATFQACKKEKEAEPRIRYVRLTDAVKADSLITSSMLGNTVAIVGENLGKAVECWFNNRKALLVPTYISDKALIVSVPSTIPTEITNKIKLIFSNGKVLEYEFKVDVASPLVSSMENEFALAGETTSIRGNFFYAPVKVVFTGGAEAEMVDIKDNIIQFKIPSGAQPGPVTVISAFGQTRSNFYFRDNRNVIIDSDPWVGANANWGSGFVITTPGPNDPPKIAGNYIRVKQAVAAGAWIQVAGGLLPSNFATINSIRTPVEAITNPDRYYLKFEVNTIKPYNGSMIRFNFGLPAPANVPYQWAPPFDSKGKWVTVTIPYEDLAASYIAANVTPVVTANGQYLTRILINHGTSSLDCDIAFDTFRIVPKIAP